MSTEAVTLQILVDENDSEGFDQIEIWRSTDSQSGPFVELTSDRWRSARLPLNSSDPPDTPVTGPSVIVVGQELELLVDGRTELTTTFAGSDPLTYTECAAQIESEGGGLIRSYVDEDAKLVIETVTVGVQALLEITGGDAITVLGLSLSQDEGQDARISMLGGQEEYTFIDPRGDSENYYKTRYRNRALGTTSEFSLPFTVGRALGLSREQIVCGFLDLVRGDGRPLANRRVQVYNPVRGELVEDKLVTGATLSAVTDVNGHVEFSLVRGTKYTVAITGTDIVREIVAPEDTATLRFPLLGEDVGTQDDVFKVQVPDIIYAERRSL